MTTEHLAQGEQDRSVVGRFWLSSWSLVDLTSFNPRWERRGNKEMIDPDPPVGIEGLPEVITEGELARFVQMQRAEGVGITEGQHG